MRIPSGDLAPARRRRRHGSRRRGRALPVLLSLLLVSGLAAAALLVRRDGTPVDRVAACPAAFAPAHVQALAQAAGRTGAQAAAQALARGAVQAPALPAPGQVRLVLLNGTARDGLGRTVGAALAARGFGVLSTGNAPQPLTGPSRVVFGPGGRPAATVLAAHVSGARLVPAPSAAAGSVQLVLGSAFVRLRTPQEVPVALRALTSTPARSVPATARPAPTVPASPC